MTLLSKCVCDVDLSLKDGVRINSKFVRKFYKVHKLARRLSGSHLHPAIMQNLDNVDKIIGNMKVAQGGSVVSQSLSDRIEQMLLREDSVKLAQIGLTVSHKISPESIEVVQELFCTLQKQVSGQAESMFLKAINVGKEMIKTMIFSLAIYYLIHKGKVLGVKTFVLSSIIVNTLFLTMREGIVKDYIISLYERIMGPSNDTVAQDASVLANLGSIVPALLLYGAAGSSSVTKGIWRSKDLDLVLRRISYFGDPKIYSGIDTITHWLQELYKRVRNFVCIHVFKQSSEKFLVEDDDPLSLWITQVDEHLASDFTRTASYDESTLSDLQRLYAEGNTFLRHRLYKGHTVWLQRSLINLLSFCEKVKRKIGTAASVRTPPITLYMYGETGEGKSTITYPMCADILKRIYTREANKIMLSKLKRHWKEMIYTRAAEQEYWDGYTGQMVTVFDDFNQQVDSASSPSMELFEIIRASNMFPYPLHMADLSEKANTHFTSKILLCSSNNKVPKTESLNYPNALLRRFAKFVQVRRDKSKKEFGTHYTFTEYDPFSPDTVIREWSYEELLEEIVSMYMSDKSFVSTIDDFVMKSIFGDIDSDMEEEEGDEKKEAQGGLTNWFFSEPQVVSLDNLQAAFEPERPTYSWEACVSYFAQKKTEMQSTFEDWKIKACSGEYRVILKNICIASGILGFLGVGVGLYKHFSGPSEKVEAEAYDNVAPKKRVEDCCQHCGSAEAYVATPLKKRVEQRTEAYEARPRAKKVEAYETMAKKKTVEAYETAPKKKVVEACADITSDEQLTKLVTRNLYRMQIEYQEGSEKKVVILGHGIFVVGRIVIFPSHFAHGIRNKLALDNSAIVVFGSPDTGRCFPTYAKDLVFNYYKTKEIKTGRDIDSRDMVSCYIGKATPHPNITTYFCKKMSLSAVGSTRVQLPVIKKAGNNFFIERHVATGSSCFKSISPLDYSTVDSAISYSVRDGWEYALETKPGDCGAPLVVINSGVAPGKVIGIHVAGSRGFGYSVQIYKEDIDNILKSYATAQNGNVAATFREQLLPPNTALLERYSGLELKVLGKLESPLVQPSKSKIRRSLLFDQVREPTTAPTWLYPRELNGEIFDPLMYRTERMGKPSVPVCQQHVDIAARALVKDIYSTYLKNKDSIDGRFPSSYSFDEAIVGVPGEGFVNSLKRDTSTGFPFVTEGLTRATLFGSQQEYDLSTPELGKIRDRVAACENAAENNIILDHYFIDTLKDERKAIGKEHKTRMFSNGPVDYLIWSKMYFNPIIAVLGELRNRCHISVGTNVYSRDWDVMTRLLTSKSEHMVAGDFEGFDASEQIELLRSSGKVLIELSRKICKSSEFECKQMEMIMESLFCSLHIGRDGVVFQWLKSLPSGHYLTAVVNSILVNLAMCMSLMEATNDYTFNRAHDFFESFGIVAYGDDHVVAVPIQYLPVFNQQTLPGLLRKFGMYYTIETKSDIEIDFQSRPITEVSYLKRSFVYDEGRAQWLAPLSLDTVLETPMWIKDCADRALQTFGNVEFAVRELALHTEDVWNKWFPKLSELVERECRLTLEYDSYSETRDLVLSD
uniref:Nonstructural polyprotein n=1 Tax=Renmark bee virus 1 TaxID=2201307 RepID=A0A2U8JQ97_9VIRU|nr:nonstructural polyprotein [Renmark bee virus 1]